MNDAQDPVGYRRGLVLGLTLAEALLLILFLLLLVYTALLQARERKIAEQGTKFADLNAKFELGLGELVSTLTENGALALDPNELSLRLEALTRDLAHARTRDEQLKTYQRIVATPEEAARIADAFDKYRIPQSPEQILNETVERAEAAKNEQTPDPADPADQTKPDAPQTLEDALAALERTTGQLAYFQRIATGKEGNGLTLPPCWQRNNQIVYTYDALLLDDGLRLSVTDDRTGMDMAGLRANGPEPPINALISERQFLDHTRGMFEWSAAQRCRFYVRILDGTSADNKAGYKRTRTTVENHFYIRVVG